MKRPSAFLLLLTCSVATAQLLTLPVELDRPGRYYAPRIFRQKSLQIVEPVGPTMPSPPSGPSGDDDRTPPVQDGVRLSDVMGRDRSINVFAGFTRDIESAALRLDDQERNTTVLAPLNSAVDKLPRKPWEDPKEYQNIGENAYEGDDGQERARKNIQRFVEAHMVTMSPWPENQKAKVVGDDRDIWWENKDGTKFVSIARPGYFRLATDGAFQIQPGNIEVASVASAVANGEVWIIKEKTVDLRMMSGKPADEADAYEREAENRRRLAQEADEMERREQEQAERRRREGYPPGPPHHSNAGSIPIHQPVANRAMGAIHSPGGLLANHGSGPAGPPPMPLGAPSGPGTNFGGPLQPDSNRPPQHAGPNNPNAQHQMFAPIPHTTVPPSNSLGAASGGPPVFGGPLQQRENHQPMQQGAFGGNAGNGSNAGTGAPLPGGQGQMQQQGQSGIAHGQQPILNDALTYLDQVKVQFHEQADVYNRFLDIMKDFKSQAIDTPGVINRVSELFAGHPTLIQGFNTFLPPGYRIECGTGTDPNTIRVTTPMGTTVQSIAGRGTQVEGAHPHPGAASQPMFQRGGNSWPQQQQQQQQQPPPQPPQHSIESPEVNFSTPAQNGPTSFGPAAQNLAAAAAFEAQNSQQRGPQIPGAHPNAPQPPRNAHTPTPVIGLAAINGITAQQQQQANERRGPVEFNHAISYVNKIKNRFQDKPEIYKQFLEILQTYQREQKPIQDVYAQVTTLFHTAPDLLEDFKQFLPESAGQAKGTPGRPGDEQPPGPGPNQTPQPSMSGQKMPPLGSFAPPSATKDNNKKRPRMDKQTPVPAPAVVDTTPVANRAASGAPPATGSTNKRTKLSHNKGPADAPAVEPTLTPLLPEPLGPPAATTSNSDEIAFFDKVKKHLGNKSAFTEFLKLCNLFSQSIIDRNTVFHKGCSFFAANAELVGFWKAFLKYEPQDDVVDNRPAPPSGKVSLSNCRGYGPSYRLLPKRERLKPCSGRDELCNSVLNDDWASHPTWASEDSGFVAHRKNGFEEGLHRIEEERHDYDFNIEANLKCIQLLEPVAQQISVMSPVERELFKMPPALADHSTSVFKRVCKKIYGDKGPEVVNDLFENPLNVVPIVLTRMKQKDEEWRFSQREWEKVWHAQVEHMHLRSLDHMGILVKQTDKRNLSAKHLVDVIKTKAEEQRRQRSLKGRAPRHQLVWDFSDKKVVAELLRLMILYAISSGQHSVPEKERICDFFETFIPAFFDIPEEELEGRLPRLQDVSEEDDAEETVPTELTNGRSRRGGKRGDLLRGVLDPGRNGSKPRGQKEGSAASGSKETTPEVGSANEEEMPDAPEDGAGPEVSSERWMPIVPQPIVTTGDDALLTADGELKADGFFSRPWYNFFCNQTIFVFFNVFQTVYTRLRDVKESKDGVIEEINRINRPRPAKDIGLADNSLNYFNTEGDVSTFWLKTIELVEEYITGEIDEVRYQDVLRHYYLKSGWKLYTIQDLLKTLCRLALICSSSDSKEKTPDLIQQYLTTREKDETNYQAEIAARKYAEKCVKDGEMFVICWFPQKSEATVRWLQREDTTFYMDEMKAKDRWQYYISSFIQVEPTEGVPRHKLQKAVLARNLPSSDDKSDENQVPKPAAFEEDLSISICLNSSKMTWKPDTSEYFVYDNIPKDKEAHERHLERLKNTGNKRDIKLREKFVFNSPWMKGMSQADVQKSNEGWSKWLKEGVLPESDAGDAMDTAE
ncbi:Paired amphipathic helix protein pst1 [Colletotrichum sidae]|uniref:Paired amphipathic helix protein pst1 n=1 Tax=Colletotrichum sidae TaxID=1347389 RepID=A0A4R8TV90_9PEZI|nr:Paired amphipathic helix protein pst1 [Colletotrichum sidae]